MLPQRFAPIERLWKERPLLFAAASAMLAALFAASFLHNREAELLRLGEPIPVLVTTRDFPAGELIEANDIEKKEFPRRFAAADALLDPKLSGMMVARVPLPKGSQLTRGTVALIGREGGLAGKVPAGKRAVALAVDDVSGVAGLVRPGDLVDLVVTLDFGSDHASKLTTLTLLEAVPVMAVGTNALDDVPRPRGKQKHVDVQSEQRQPTITVVLAPEEVQQALFAQEAGTVQFSLRQRGEEANAERLSPTTMRDIAGSEELLRGRRSYREYKGR